MNGCSVTNRSHKRPRLSYNTLDLDLNEKRARHDLHLKSRFEEIFRKYGKDFTETADEIDLETGEIVVDKGHLIAMTDETDPGHDFNSSNHRQWDETNAADELSWEGTEESCIATNDNVAISESPRIPTTVPGSPKSQQASRVKVPQSSISSTQSPRLSQHKPWPYKKDDQNDTYTVQSPQASGGDTSNWGSKSSHPTLSLYRQAAEPDWQAPPLPEDQMKESSRPIIHSISLDEEEMERSPSPIRSLWAPVTGPGRPRYDELLLNHQTMPTRRKTMVQLRRPRVALRAEHQYVRGTYVASKKHRKKWTWEEVELVKKLRETTTLSYVKMEPYFDGRTALQLAWHWRKAMRSGERGASPIYGTAEESSDHIEIEGKSMSSDTLHVHHSAPSKVKARIQKQPNSHPGHLSKRILDSYSSPSLGSKLSKNPSAITPDDFDELGDDPLESRVTAIRLSNSSPNTTCSQPHPPLTPSSTQRKRQLATPQKSNSHSQQQRLHHRLSRSSPTRKESKDEPSDYDELAMSPPRERASAPSSRIRSCDPAIAPIPLKKSTDFTSLQKATMAPKPIVVEESSEDELATPFKRVSRPTLVTNHFGIRRRSSLN